MNNDKHLNTIIQELSQKHNTKQEEIQAIYQDYYVQNLYSHNKKDAKLIAYVQTDEYYEEK